MPARAVTCARSAEDLARYKRGIGVDPVLWSRVPVRHGTPGLLLRMGEQRAECMWRLRISVTVLFGSSTWIGPSLYLIGRFYPDHVLALWRALSATALILP